MAEEIERYRAEVSFRHKFENIERQLGALLGIPSPTFYARNLVFYFNISRDAEGMACYLLCGINGCSLNFEYTLTLLTPSKRVQSEKFSGTFNDKDSFHRTILSEIFPGQEIVVDDAISLEVALWAGEPENENDHDHDLFSEGYKFKPPKEELRQYLQVLENQVQDNAFASLFDSGDFSDVNFVVEEDSSRVKAHKAILAARSQVFARMLATDMTEAKDNEIKIDDMGGDSLKIMLRYIYSGQLGFPKGVKIDLKICQELANAGEKYDLQNLKEYAAMAMTEFVSLENAWELLKFAKRLKAETATDALTAYYLGNVRKIIEKL